MKIRFQLILLSTFLLLGQIRMSDSDSDKNSHIEDDNSEKLSTQNLSSTLIIVLGIMAFNNYILEVMKNFRKRFAFIGKCVPDASVSTFLGVLVGLVTRLIPSLNFNNTIKESFESLFMILLQPPIQFEAALNMQKRPFFKNIGGIIIFAIFGTMLSVVIIATLMWVAGSIEIAKYYSFYHCLIFGSLISATDPVAVLASFKEIDPHLKQYSLIFGESIQNDAISITLYRSLLNVREKANFSPIIAQIEFFSQLSFSCIIGLVFGFFAAFMLKRVDLKNPKHINQELSIMIVFAWLAYLTAESFEFSGIVSIMFCGICMAQYAQPNMSLQAKKNIKQVFHTIAENFESQAFILIGTALSGFNHNFKDIGIGLLVMGFLILLFARYCNIFGLSFQINYFENATKINGTFQFVLWFSGFRGAMAFAIAIQASNKFAEDGIGSDFLTLTVVYTCITIFVFGGFLQTVIEKNDVKAKKTDKYDFERKKCCDYLKIKFMEINKNFLEKLFVRADKPIEKKALEIDDCDSSFENKQKNVILKLENEQGQFVIGEVKQKSNREVTNPKNQLVRKNSSEFSPSRKVIEDQDKPNGFDTENLGEMKEQKYLGSKSDEEDMYSSKLFMNGNLTPDPEKSSNSQSHTESDLNSMKPFKSSLSKFEPAP